MTLGDAIDRARTIQRDLEAGRLTIPYPDPIRRELLDLCGAFSRLCRTKEEARHVIARIQGPDGPPERELPW